ncbi:MAG: iron transporter FeoA [Desulfotalea sp.]|nr:MAG: iron transporter FeoA [Desulfotalea sp.]
MSKKINLTEAVKGMSYRIAGFINQESDYSEKLSKMGFVAGTPIELAPVKIFDPLVFQIRGSRIALRRKEAKEILVEGV